MIKLAILMLIGNKAKYLSLLSGVLFASMLIVLQTAIFLGYTKRSYLLLDQIPQPDIWVMHPDTEDPNFALPLSDNWLSKVQSRPGVLWAEPFYYSFGKIKFPNGSMRYCFLFGLNSPALIGAPIRMTEGEFADLLQPEAVFIDARTVEKLAAVPTKEGTLRTLQLGDSIDLNGKRGKLTGIFDFPQQFFIIPNVITTFQRITERYTAKQADHISFILVKTKPHVDATALAREIGQATGLKALSKEGFKDVIISYFFSTGVLYNMAIMAGSGLFIGTFVIGKLFSSFTAENLALFTVLKAMGASHRYIVLMILCQAALVGAIGYTVSVGLSVLFFFIMRSSSLAFYIPWQLLAVSAFMILGMCLLSALFSIYKVLRLDPAEAFRGRL